MTSLSQGVCSTTILEPLPFACLRLELSDGYVSLIIHRWFKCIRNYFIASTTGRFFSSALLFYFRFVRSKSFPESEIYCGIFFFHGCEVVEEIGSKPKPKPKTWLCDFWPKKASIGCIVAKLPSASVLELCGLRKIGNIKKYQERT